ncbi:MAG TPA: hypothetical protein VH592_16575 [Gemmataceae bacterium]|jgi:hypothetical protein
MTKEFPIEQDDSYEVMAATYQVIEIARLNEVLKRHKIPEHARREICTDYFFENGVFLDSGWLKLSGNQVFPTFCFAERPVDPNEGLGEITKLYIPSQFFSFHEYAHGDIAFYFEDEAESIENIDHGNL